MLAVMKEIGIFIVISQAILYFAPEESYGKYVKVIIGIMMIAKMAEPVLALTAGGEWEGVIENVLETSFAEESYTEAFLTENHQTEILNGVEEEIKEQLNQKQLSEFYVKKVSLKMKEGEIEGVVLTLSEKAEKETGSVSVEKIVVGDKETETEMAEENKAGELQKVYAKELELLPEQIELRKG